MTPLERAARALIDLSPTVNGYHQSHIDMMMPKVRAVIEAIREPDVAMACRGLGEWQSSTDFGALETEAADFDLAWKAMIDRLLEE